MDPDARKSVGWDPRHGARIVNAEEHDATIGVRKCDQLAGKLLRVGGDHAAPGETHFLELRTAILPGTELIHHLVSIVEHGFTLQTKCSGGRTQSIGPSVSQ